MQYDPDESEQSVPLVSVIMPAYNAGPYIGEAIQSILDQTFANWDLIVVDDGSTDNTAEVVATFLSDRRIRYHKQPNGGEPVARNTGIELSHGNLIAWLDADDIWFPEKLAKQIEIFAEYPEVGFCGTGLVTVDSKGLEKSRITRNPFHGQALRTSYWESACFDEFQYGTP